MASVTYGDAMRRGATTSVFQFHVDSRNRENVRTTTPSTYTMKLGSNVQRASTLQIGDVQLPTDARKLVDFSRRHVQVAFPLHMEEVSTLTLTESTRTYDRESGVLLSSSSKPPVSVQFPATLNRIASCDDGLSQITCTKPHCIDAALVYWPAQPPQLIATRALGFTPRVTASTLQSLTNASAFQLNASAVAELLSYTDGVTTLSAAVVGTAASAYLYNAPLTYVEWVRVLNSVLADLTEDGALAQPYEMRVSAMSGTVELQCVGGDTLTPRTRTETSLSITCVAGDVMWRLGFPTGTWELRTYQNTRLAANGTRVDSTPYVMRVTPRDTRTLQLARGNYATPDSLALELARASNSLYFVGDAAARTLRVTDALGQDLSIIIPYGRYTPSQFADFLEDALNAASQSPFFDVSITTQGDGTSGLAVSDTLARPFALDFSANAALAAMLGFNAVRVEGTSSHTSTRAGWCGTNTAGPHMDAPVVLTWTADVGTSRFRVTAAAPIPSCDATLSTSPTVANTYTAECAALGTTTQYVAPHIMVSDVVLLSDGVSSVTAVCVAAAAGSTIHRVSLDLGAVDVSTDLDVGGALTLMPLTRPAFVLNAAPMADGDSATVHDVTGARIVNPILERAAQHVGRSTSYAPLYETLGFSPTFHTSSDDGLLTGDAAYNLAPPAYVLLALLHPTFVSGRTTFRSTRDDHTRSIIAKFIVTNGYARITEESTHVTTTSPLSLDSIQIAWLNPDGTLVDWDGRNHSYSILIRALEGHTEGLIFD